MAKEMNYYVVLTEKNQDTTMVLRGHAPRQAALKAATRGVKNIRLRERGRKYADKKTRIHVFTGSVDKIPKPENSPAWMPDQINKPVVSKVKTEVVRL